MKCKIIIACCLLPFSLLAQKIVIKNNGLEKDTIKVKEAELVGALYLDVSLTEYWDTAEILYSKEEGTASEGKDFSFPESKSKILLDKTTKTSKFTILIQPDTTKEAQEFVNLKFCVANKDICKTITLIIQDDDSSVVAPSKPINNILGPKVTYLNAFAFDFGNLNKNITYVANINIFDFHKSSKRKRKSENVISEFGYNAGITKINYKTNDTVYSNNPQTDWMARKLFDTLQENGVYRVEQNVNYRSITNREYGFYFQPLWLLNSENTHKNKIILHAHFEMLVSKWEVNLGYNTLRADSINYVAALHGGANSASLKPGPTLNQPILRTNKYLFEDITGNFGAGLTYITEPIEGVHFFSQGTIGYNTKGVAYNTFNPRYGLFKNEENRIVKFYNTFFQIRSYIDVDLGANSQFRLGTDIRGFLKYGVPKYAIYAGVVLDAVGLAKAFK
jgi:hypothetical protein